MKSLLNDLRQYLRRGVRCAVLFAALLAVMAGIYALYGLPWGPAVYTMLVMTAVFAATAAVGFVQWRSECEALRRLNRQAIVQLDELPPAREEKERQYQQLAERLEQRCQKAEQDAEQSASRARRYYTLWSHQVKTPLAAMDLLLQEPTPSREQLRQELVKMSQYVDMALQYQRLEQGSDLVLRTCPLDDIVRDALKRTSALFIHKKLQLHWQPTGLRVLTDEKWLAFVLEQLLTNAVKYTPTGGSVTIRSEASPLCVWVEDSGIGIRPEDLPRVCEWGYTGQNGRAGRNSTGIGLALCRQAMEMLGHKMTITSTPGKGTQVRLELERRELDVRD